MKNVKKELKKIIIEVMLPESQNYKEELEVSIKENKSNDDIETKEDIESFIEELKSILTALEKNELSNEDAMSAYEKIVAMIEEHEED